MSPEVEAGVYARICRDDDDARLGVYGARSMIEDSRALCKGLGWTAGHVYEDNDRRLPPPWRFEQLLAEIMTSKV